jgi:hypothetical protein
MICLLRVLWRLMRLRVRIPLLVAAAIAYGWMMVRPRPFPLDARRTELADEVAGKLAESLPLPSVGRPAIVVLPFERDPSGSVTDAVRRAIQRVDRYAVQASSLWENVLRESGFGPQPVALEQAESLAASHLPGEYLLAGRVEMLSARTDMDEAVLEGVLVPVGSANPSGAPMVEVSGPQSSHAAPVAATPVRTVRLRAEAIHDHLAATRPAPVETYPWPARLVVWLLVVLLLPLVVSPLASRALERESNAMNLVMLLGLTAITGVAALAMLGFRLETAWSAVLLLAGVGLALGYNWMVLSKLEELRV